MYQVSNSSTRQMQRRILRRLYEARHPGEHKLTDAEIDVVLDQFEIVSVENWSDGSPVPSDDEIPAWFAR